MDLIIQNGQVLLPSGEIERTDIVLSEGRIVEVGSAPSGLKRKLDVGGRLVMPGIVDIHGDAFERQVMPRPGVFFSPELALLDTDQQLVANGITTAYHGLTCSWEPGLRSMDAARRFIAALGRTRRHLSCDTRLHLRFETAAISAVEEIETWIQEGLVDFLTFNDHLDHIRRKAGDPDKLLTYTSRTKLKTKDFIDLLAEVELNRDHIPMAIERLAKACRDRSLPMASHDDATPDIRQKFHDLGCRICEFPVGRETAGKAIHLGDPVILGAPNALRGKSHDSRLTAREAIAEGLCTVLSSDYYYPSLLQAPFALDREGILPLGKAWNLVSRNAAQAVFLTDRGEITPGSRADLLIVDNVASFLPRMVVCFTLGKPALLSGDLAKAALGSESTLDYLATRLSPPRHATAI